jgi:amino acid adenylation domain-containing protein
MMSMQFIQDLRQQRVGADHDAYCWGAGAGPGMPMAVLRAHAERWAVGLRRHGVRAGAEDRVLILLPRSADLLTAHLAVFLAGGLPVVLDPAYPAERIAETADLVAPVLSVAAPGAVGLTGMTGQVLSPQDLDGVRLAPLGPRAPIRPQDAAYIVFTSGSTGRPKGVVVEWRGFADFLSWHLDYVGLGPRDCVSLTNSPGFDVSVWELWVALASGASVHICTDDERLDPHRLQRAWISHQVTSAFVATPLMERLLAAEWPDGEHAPRMLLTGGDRLRRRPRPDAPYTLVNAYGPAECCPCSTVGITEPTDSENSSVLPDIGRPLPHVRAYVLDDAMLPVPDGELGRLWIGGSQVARGYLNDPAGTAGRFRPDPFSGHGSDRIYNSGDLVTRQPDGRLAFHGRDDQQVKIDGVRVELAEVESIMTRHPAVREAIVVCLRVPGLDADRLCCSVVLADDAPAGAKADLADHARRLLPRPMVPVDIMTLPGMPLTANGKWDRRMITWLHSTRLAESRDNPATARAAHGGPGDDLSAVIGIWQEVLGQQVEPDSDFWSLGANSLQAVQIARRITIATGRDCPPSRVLRARTPRALAGEALTAATREPS